jgi:hypothetical protein
MSFQLGDVVPLSVTVRDADGNPADAGSVALTVTLPDGTTDVTANISSTSTGVYDHDYATVQAGRHGVRWVATGTNASAFTDVFDVEPADDGDFISLADIKKHLRKTSDADDADLAGFISAACQMIVERIGPVSPTPRTDTVHVRGWCDNTIVLDASPVITVTSVTVRGPSPVTVPQADPDAGVDGWELHAGAGVLTHTRRWPTGTLQILYRVGRIPPYGNVRLAGLELTGHLWKQSQLNTGSITRPPSFGDDQVIMPGAAYALPIRVRELLGLGKNPTTEVLVG